MEAGDDWFELDDDEGGEAMEANEVEVDKRNERGLQD